MALIEQANIVDKINHQNLFRERTASTDKDLKTLSFNVYSSRHLISITKQIRIQHADVLILPSIDKDENRQRRKTKRPYYRTSLYHSSISNSPRIDLPVLTIHHRKSEVPTIMNIRRQQTPPPTPSNDQLERLIIELNQTRQSTPQSSTDVDGDIPYRLPALIRSTNQGNKEKNSVPKHIKSTLKNYYQTLYSKY